MKNFTFPVVLLMLAAVAKAQPSGTSTTTTTPTTTTTTTMATTPTNTNTGTPGTAVIHPDMNPNMNRDGMDQMERDSMERDTNGYNRDTASDTIAYPPSATTTTGAAPVPITMTGAMSDNQIAGVLMTIDDGEIASAKMALRRAKNAEVKDFARKMVSEHKENMKDTRRMLKTYNSGTARSDLGATLRNDAKESNRMLSDSSQTSFDKMYIDQQVTMHEKALSTLNETLLPNVTDTNLKAQLEKTKTAIADHLNAARALQSKVQ